MGSNNFAEYKPNDIEEYGRNMSALANPSVELMEEWLIYTWFQQESCPI